MAALMKFCVKLLRIN